MVGELSWVENQCPLQIQLLTGKTYAQSEPDIISAVAARKAIWGIVAIEVSQGVPSRSVRVLNSCGFCRLRRWITAEIVGIIIRSAKNMNDHRNSDVAKIWGAILAANPEPLSGLNGKILRKLTWNGENFQDEK